MKNNYVKKSIFTLMMMAGLAIQAQSTSASEAGLEKGNGEGVSVKLIDNKGTIKYLQTNNGITSITSTTAGSATTTTWQLGGALSDDTYIDVDGNVFALDGIELVDTASLAPSADAADLSDHGTGTGWTLLVRDEATGAIKKLKASDLVSGIRIEHIQASDASADVAITVTGLPVLAAGTTFAKLFVYRNGAKLRSVVDFVATANTVTITYSASDLPMYTGDVVEIQYIK
jgi:hypothetical protein